MIPSPMIRIFIIFSKHTRRDLMEVGVQMPFLLHYGLVQRNPSAAIWSRDKSPAPRRMTDGNGFAMEYCLSFLQGAFERRLKLCNYLAWGTLPKEEGKQPKTFQPLHFKEAIQIVIWHTQLNWTHTLFSLMFMLLPSSKLVILKSTSTLGGTKE